MRGGRGKPTWNSRVRGGEGGAQVEQPGEGGGYLWMGGGGT